MTKGFNYGEIVHNLALTKKLRGCLVLIVVMEWKGNYKEREMVIIKLIVVRCLVL